jgi:hypothetical protein
MLGILLYYFIWKYFAELAELHSRKKWPFGLMGIGFYIVGTFVGGIIIALLNNDILAESNDLKLSLMAIPIGLITCVIGYKLLERYWKKNALPQLMEDDINNFGSDV